MPISAFLSISASFWSIILRKPDLKWVTRFKIWCLTVTTPWACKNTFLRTKATTRQDQRSHSVWKPQKKSHSTLRAKRAKFTIWVDKSSLKMPQNGQFWRFYVNLKLAVKQCYQTGHFLTDKNWWEMTKFKCDILSNFQTMCSPWKSLFLFL